jgi:hypothetical protein
VAAKEWTEFYCVFDLPFKSSHWCLEAKLEGNSIQWQEVYCLSRRLTSSEDKSTFQAPVTWLADAYRGKVTQNFPNGHRCHMNMKEIEALYSWYEKEISKSEKEKLPLTKSQILQKIFEDD